MTYDTAVWRRASGDLPDPTAEFTRRMDASEARYPRRRPTVPELDRLADLLEQRFPGVPPWEDLRDSIDGDFLYLTMTYDGGPEVENVIAGAAAGLGLVVYSPLSEDWVGPDDWSAPA